MNVEAQLRALGTRLGDTQAPITVDDVLRADGASGADAFAPDRTGDGASRLALAEQDADHEMRIIMLSPDQKHDSTRRRAWPLLAAAAIVLVVVAALVVANRSDDDSSATQPAIASTVPEAPEEASPGPAEVLEQYRVAYNAGDIDGVMALFTEDSTLINHPLAATEAVGLDLVRRVHRSDIGSAAESNAYEFSNVEVSGDTVTWDTRWTNDQGARYCAEGHRALVTDGKILTWTFGPDVHRCD